MASAARDQDRIYPGIFAKTFPGTTADSVLAQVKAAGFVATQFNMACCGLPSMPDRIEGSTAVAIGAASHRHQVELSALSGTFNMIHPDPKVQEQGLARLRVLAHAARQLSIRTVTLCTGTRDPDDQWRHHPDNASREAWRDLCASMEQAIAIAEEFGILLGIEPELANVVDTAPKARRLLDELGSDRLAIVLDPANLFEVASPSEQRLLVEQAADLLGPRIVLAHAKDRAPDGSFATAGQGVIDFGHYIASLRRVGFTGPLIAHGLTADEAPAVAAFLAARLA